METLGTGVYGLKPGERPGLELPVRVLGGATGGPPGLCVSVAKRVVTIVSASVRLPVVIGDGRVVGAARYVKDKILTAEKGKASLCLVSNHTLLQGILQRRMHPFSKKSNDRGLASISPNFEVWGGSYHLFNFRIILENTASKTVY